MKDLPLIRSRGPALLAAVLLAGCTAPHQKITVPEPVSLPSAPRVRKVINHVLPRYLLLSGKDAKTTAVTRLPSFAATEAEPENAGRLPKQTSLTFILLQPGRPNPHPADQVSIWLYAILDSPEPLTGLLLQTAAEGYAQIYLNGTAVYSGGHTARTFRVDADEIPGISLRKGENLLAIHLTSRTSFWKFSLRFLDAKGFPLYWQSR